MTNAQKIKQKVNNMTISELADFIIEHCEGCDHCVYEDEYTCNKDCNYGVEAWLRKRREWKMTDDEIIKALGYCKRSVGAILCTSECPMYSECDSEDPMVDICGLAIDLINQQKAEIERLQDELHRAKVEISKHFDYMDEAKSEAIKEFAERLKEKKKHTVDNELWDYDINNIANELLKGGENNER